MKVTNLRRKLIATLAAGGFLAPGVLHAANLNTNLVVNAGFENVDLLTTGGSNGPLILDWTTNGITNGPFAYAHAGGGGQGSDFANGGPLSAGGQYYFTANNGTPDVNAPGMVYQDIDVSGGASGTLIQSGNGIYGISASISSYAAQGDLGHVHLDFLNAALTSLGTVDLTTNNTSAWTTNAKGGAIPSTTHTVRVSVYGTTTVSGGPDGYIDNVQFLVSNEPLQPALLLTIDRDNGSMVLANKTGSPVNISGYQITSPFEGLAPANWLSIADNYDQGSPGANQIDAVHQWSELTDPTSRADLSEADLASGAGTSLAHSKTVNLSSSGAWIRNPHEDIVFKYVSNGQVVNGIVSYVDNGGVGFAQGDLNTDGAINAADWTVLKTNLHTSLTGKSLAEAYRFGDLNQDKANNHADFVAFKTFYDAANGVGAFTAMIAAVPEPSTLALSVVIAAAAVPVARRRRLLQQS